MNNSSPNPLDGPIDFKQIKMLTNTLLDLPYAEIIKKYDRKDFFGRVLNFNIQSDIILLRDMMAEDFLPSGSKAITKLPVNKREKVIQFLAQNSETANLEASLKQIDPALVLPKNFDGRDYRDRAIRIYNALQSIKISIAEEGYINFLDDTNRFFHLPSEKIQELTKEINAISAELEQEYINLQNHIPLNPTVINKAADLTGKMGRIPAYIETLKEQGNLGEVSEVIQKLSTSLRIAAALQTKKLQNLGQETIAAEIKNYLVNNIEL